ncbi:MFS general substrate transporter [Serendipita vermifera]|nr:MFS general substrate transporter [Serendipita vermifera]
MSTSKDDLNLEKGTLQNGHHANEIKTEHHEKQHHGDVPEGFLVPATEATEEEGNKSFKTNDPNVIDWDGPHDPRNPKNWSAKKKWASMSTVAIMCFVSPFASTLPASALPQIAKNFHITNSSVAALCVSIFVLAYAFGPLVASPASELYGRSPVYIGGFVIFLAFNIASALAKNTVQFIVCRFFAGIGGSAAITVGAGTS